MTLARRTLLLGALLACAGCTGDPTVKVPDGAEPRSRTTEEPVQAPSLARAAALIAGLREEIATADAGPWREAALAQCDAQLARFNSVNPFGEPDPIFTPPPASGDAVEGLVKLAQQAEEASDRLLFLSAAVATKGLEQRDSVPEAGAEPTHVETLRGQVPVALSHVWALIYGLEMGLGRLSSDDPLRDQGSQRLAEAKTLRNDLRTRLEGPAPSQPPAFDLATPMSTPDEIRQGWAALEVQLLESLVLLSAEAGAKDTLWEEQVARAQGLGGRIPRWPGWD